jgi:hypothetical protein
MKKFMVLYMATSADFEKAMKDATPEQQKKGMEAWMQWMTSHKGSIVDNGAPLGKTKRVDAKGATDTKNGIMCDHCAAGVVLPFAPPTGRRSFVNTNTPKAIQNSIAPMPKAMRPTVSPKIAPLPVNALLPGPIATHVNMVPRGMIMPRPSSVWSDRSQIGDEAGNSAVVGYPRAATAWMMAEIPAKRNAMPKRTPSQLFSGGLELGADPSKPKDSKMARRPIATPIKPKKIAAFT